LNKSICLLYGVLNGLTVSGPIDPFSVSEEEAVPECLSGLDMSGHLLLSELEKLFARHPEPVRPGRTYPRLKKRKPGGKYYTLTGYKRAM
jgi:hypothetical protein